MFCKIKLGPTDGTLQAPSPRWEIQSGALADTVRYIVSGPTPDTMQIQCQIQSRHKGSATVSQHPPGEGHHVMPTNPNPDRARRAAAPSAAVVVRNEESDSEEEAIIAAQRTARGGAPAVAVAVLAEPRQLAPVFGHTAVLLLSAGRSPLLCRKQ